MSWSDIGLAGFSSAMDFGSSLFGDYRSRKAASSQRKWLQYMDNTKHQRQVADLRAAGLNPILSATGGSLGVPNAQMARVPDYETHSAQSYAALRQLRQQDKLIDSQVEKNIAESRLAQAQQWNAEYNSDFIKANANLNRILATKEANTAYGISLDNRDKEYSIQALESLGGAQKHGSTVKLLIDLLKSFRN